MNIEQEQPANASVVIIVDSDDQMKPQQPAQPIISEQSVVEIPRSAPTAPDQTKQPRLEKRKSQITKQLKRPTVQRTISTGSQYKGDDRYRKRRSKECEVVEDIDSFIPDELIFLDHMKHKNLVRVGENYQALIPAAEERELYEVTWQPCMIWDSSLGFNLDVFEKFKEKFGERRTQEELCELLVNNQCSWVDLPQLLESRKKYYKQLFNQKDRNATYK